MSISLKLLVELNNEKYSVFVESDYKFVKFKTVSNEIITQLNNKNISLKTHLFELFDPDFGEYVLVSNENQLVENLSRIRVKAKEAIVLMANKDNTNDGGDCLKDKLNDMSVADNSISKTSSDMSDKELNNFCDYLFGNSKNFIKNNAENKSVAKSQTIGSSAKSLDQFIENNLTEKTKELAKYLFNFNESSDKVVNKDINVEEVVVRTDDLTSDSTDDTVVEASNQQTIRNSGQTAAQPQQNAANYLDLEESNNYRLSSSCPHLHHKTFVERFRKQSVIIIRIRYEDFKAIQYLLDLLDINRRCFQKNPSNEVTTNPKWRTVSDQMVNNGFDDWTALQCRDGFYNALDLYRKCLDRCPDYDTAIKVNPLFMAFHSFDLKFIICLSEFNVIRDLRDLFGRKLTKFNQNSGFNQRKYNSNHSLGPRNTFEDMSGSRSPSKHRDRVFQNSSKMGSTISLHTMSNGFDNKAKSSSQIDKLKLKNIGLKVDNYLIDSFKALSKSVDTICAQFGHVTGNRHFWDLVSNQMIANGYKTYSSHYCRQIFTENVCDYYSLALTYCSDMKNAQEVYPLFKFIHSMDLCQSLSPSSFLRIKELRKSFEQKSDFFQQMFTK